MPELQTLADSRGTHQPHIRGAPAEKDQGPGMAPGLVGTILAGGSSGAEDLEFPPGKADCDHYCNALLTTVCKT